MPGVQRPLGAAAILRYEAIMSHRSALIPLLLGSWLLVACPLARPKSADCGSVKNQIEKVDARVHEFAAIDPKTATVGQFRSWASGLSEAQASFAPTDTIVHDDVKQAANQYKTALDALATAVRDSAMGKGSPEAVVAARAALTASTTQLDERCAK